MVEWGIQPEVLQQGMEALGLLSVGFMMALSKNQRGSILYRDGRMCQMDCDNAGKCGGECDRLEVHHVKPQHAMRQQGEDPDYAENVVTLCSTFHQQEVHGLSQHEVQDALNNGEPYWNTTHDERLGEIAEENTRAAQRRGWIFPKK